MGVGHLKSSRSQMRGNNLLYEIFRGGGGGVGIAGALSFFETSVGVAFGLCSDLCWTRMTFFLPVYLSQLVALLS